MLPIFQKGALRMIISWMPSNFENLKPRDYGNKRRNTGKEDFETPPEREKDYPITGSDKI